MSRMIDADALYDEIHKGQLSALGYEGYDDYTNINNIDDALDAIKYAPTVNQWISVSEKLPEEDTDVLVTVHFKGLEQKHPNGWNDNIKPCYYVEIASQIDGEWHSASDEYKIAINRHEVIAWMPLPEPYKEINNG